MTPRILLIIPLALLEILMIILAYATVLFIPKFSEWIWRQALKLPDKDWYYR